MMTIRDDRMTGVGACGARQHARRRAGFTLTEMIVAVGLLLLVMGMASAVFKVTLDGTSELQGRSEVDRSIRMLKRILGRDLGRIDPSRGVLAIQGNPAPAYWNRAQLEADADGNPLNEALPPDLADPERQNPTLGYAPLNGTMGFDPTRNDDNLLQPPRADILMFVTQLPDARSYLDPEIQSDGPVMVVYNHAELGRFNDEGRAQVDLGCGPGNGTSVCNSNPLNDWATEPAKIPDLASGADPTRQIVASEWHLARRALLLKNSPDPLDDDITDEQDRYAHILSPTNPADNRWVDNPAQLSTPYERHYLEWIRSGGMDVVGPVRRDGDGDFDDSSVSGLHIPNRAQDFVFEYEISNRIFGFGRPDDLLSLDVFADEARIRGAAIVPNRTFTPGGFGQAGNIYFRGGLPAYWLARSKLDPDPPASMLHRMGHAFMENCASFKVEWTPNDVRLDRAGLPEVVWIDPFKEPGRTRLENSVTDAPVDALTNTPFKPLHLDEFEILAQKMCPPSGADDVELWENACLGTEDPSPFKDAGGSLLHKVHQALIPRFGLSYPDLEASTLEPLVAFNQVNVFDAKPETYDVIDPSHNTHAWFARDVEFGSYPGAADPTLLYPRTSDNVDPAWPRALRITVDLYPPGVKDDGSFGLPVRHVFVLPLGANGDTKKKLG